MQVNAAMATRLPQATAQHLVEEMLDYYGQGNLLVKDAMYSGLSLALARLSEYLAALPPPEAVPTITFAAGQQSPLGLDTFRYEAHRSLYEQVTVNEEPYPMAWQALPSGQTTTVLAQVEKGVSFPPGVVFKQNGNTIASQPAGQNHQQRLTLTGQAHEQEGVVEVYESQAEDAPLVGKLNTISYDALYQKLVLVVLDDVLSDPPYLANLSAKLQAIFAQAGVNLTIEHQEFDTGWGDRGIPLEDETYGMLSNYPKELKRIIKDYHQEHETEKGTAYVFLAGRSSTGKLGYMPKKRAFGFVYLEEHTGWEPVAKTIAHELGHGLFRLKHTFQTYPSLTKGSTDNLMDYGRGTRLHQYQWDYVHNPQAMLGWFQDEEENALDICFWAKSLLIYNSVFGKEHVLTPNMPLYNEVKNNFDLYWKQSEELFKKHRFGKDKENNLALQSNSNWTVRNASHYQKTDSTMFVDHAIKAIVNKSEGGVMLHEQGVTLAKIELEGKHYQLAAYSTAHNIKPDYVRVDELCDLVDHQDLQVYQDEGQSFIAFLKGDVPELVIQLLTDDKDDVEVWLEYLGILVVEEPEWFSKIPPFWEDWTWDNAVETLNESSDIAKDDPYNYIVSDGDAWYREQEAPYKTIAPDPAMNILGQGWQVSVLETMKGDKDKEVAKIKLKSNDSIAYTTLSNLSEVKATSKELKYKMTKDYTAVKLPYSSENTEKNYAKDTEFTAYKRCGDYVKVKGKGGDIEGHWIEKSAAVATEPEFEVETKVLQEVFTSADTETLESVVETLNEYSNLFGLTDEDRIANFLAQTGYESDSFKGRSGESGCYKSSNLPGWEIWFGLTWKEKPYAASYDQTLNTQKHRSKKLKWQALKCDSTATECVKVPDEYVCTKKGAAHDKKFFSYVYQAEGGNGDSQSEDGYKYRGHGAIQLTWKKTYQAFQEWLDGNYKGDDIPDVVEDPTILDTDKEIFLLSALWYWQENRLNKKIPSDITDDEAFEKFTERINADALEWEIRQQYAESLIEKLKN